VLGVLTASSATGQLVFLPLAAWLVDNLRLALCLAPSVIGLLIAGLLVVLFMCDRPSDVGLAAYGEAARRPAKPLPRRRRSRRRLSARLFGACEISTSGTFWILAATFFICGLSTTARADPFHLALRRLWHCRRSPPPRRSR